MVGQHLCKTELPKLSHRGSRPERLRGGKVPQPGSPAVCLRGSPPPPLPLPTQRGASPSAPLPQPRCRVSGFPPEQTAPASIVEQLGKAAFMSLGGLQERLPAWGGCQVLLTEAAVGLPIAALSPPQKAVLRSFLVSFPAPQLHGSHWANT